MHEGFMLSSFIFAVVIFVPTKFVLVNFSGEDNSVTEMR